MVRGAKCRYKGEIKEICECLWTVIKYKRTYNRSENRKIRSAGIVSGSCVSPRHLGFSALELGFLTLLCLSHGTLCFPSTHQLSRELRVWLGFVVLSGSHSVVHALHDLGNLLLEFHFTREAVSHAGILFGGDFALAESGT